jgi:hypothetical protein
VPQCINLYEVMAFTPSGQLLTAAVVGATANTTSTYGSNYVTYINDMFADPYGSSEGESNFYNSGCGSNDKMDIVFPNSGAAPVSTVYVVNRMDGSCSPLLCNTRITTGLGNLTLYLPNGTRFQQPLTSGSVTTLSYPGWPSVAPIFPNLTSDFQTDPDNLELLVRYVRVVAAPGYALAFRELMVFDDTWTNVALLKPATASAQQDATTNAAMGNDGVLTMDAGVTGNQVQSAGLGSGGWWQVDLGGVYDISGIIFWNRYNTKSSTTGATVLFMNAYGATDGHPGYDSVVTEPDVSGCWKRVPLGR